MRSNWGLSLNSSDHEMIDLVREGLGLSMPLATDMFVVRSALSWLAREIRQNRPVDLPPPPPDPTTEAMTELRAKLSPDVEERTDAQLRDLAARLVALRPKRRRGRQR